jgi:hypothetical protein
MQGKAQVFEDLQRCAHPGLLPEKRDQAVEVSGLLSLPPVVVSSALYVSNGRMHTWCGFKDASSWTSPRSQASGPVLLQLRLQPVYILAKLPPLHSPNKRAIL